MGQESFGRYISSIYRHLQILINHELSEFGIGSGQYVFLGEIARNEGISQKELSRIIQIDKATTTKAIKKLEEECYIYRVSDPSDNRYNNLHLTKKGRNFIPVFKDRMSNITTILSKGMTEKQRNETIGILDFLLKNTIDAVENLKKNT